MAASHEGHEDGLKDAVKKVRVVMCMQGYNPREGPKVTGEQESLPLYGLHEAHDGNHETVVGLHLPS